MSLFSCSPCRLRSEGRSSLRRETGSWWKIFRACNCAAFFPLSFLRLVCLYTLKRIFLPKHIFDCAGVFRIPQDHQLHFWISEGTDMLDDCRVQSPWPVQVIPQLSKGLKGGQGEGSGWLVTICLTCIPGQWLGVVGTKWKELGL